jgi:hypothetical protein
MVGLLLAGCADPPVGQPDPQPFAVESADVWSGTSLTLMSAGFAGADPAAVLLDADTVPFTRVNDSTLTVSVPDLPGTHQLRVSSPLVLATPIPVHLSGYLDAAYGPVFGGRAVRGTALTEVFGYGPVGLRRWNVSTGQTWDYPDSMHVASCTRGVGAGAHAGELVLHSFSCASRWQVWRLEPTLEHLDTTQWVTDRFVDVLGPGRYVLPRAHDFIVASCDTACVYDLPMGESGFDVVHSPTGEWAVPLAYTASDSGAAVIDAAAGRVRYVVPPFRSAMGATFSDGGDTLYLAGQDHYATLGGAGLLVALRASDGLRLAAESLSYAPCAVALDPARPWLYVAGLYNNLPDYWSVLGVFEQTTLKPIVTLRVSDGAIFTGTGTCKILSSPLERRVYVIETWNGPFYAGSTPLVARFETPP